MPQQRWRRIRPWLAVSLGAMILYYIQAFPIGQRLNLFLAPVFEAVRAPLAWWEETKLWFDDRQELQEENIRLRNRLQGQAALVQTINTLREENSQLRSLLELDPIPEFIWQAAKVVARSPEKMSRHLIIKIQHAKPDDVVASSEGLVGLIDDVGPDFAVVRTILDASLAVPVTVREHPLAALLRGQGNSLKVEFVPMEEAPQVGTILVTSGSGGVFPAGIPVARITKITPRQGDIFVEMEARPLAHWRRESWLAVAISRQP